jgi:hypothetical protein
MKGQWESNINVWVPIYVFPEMKVWSLLISKNRIKMFYFPISTFIYLWEIYIFPRSVCLFCWSQICEPILGLYETLTDTWMCTGTEAEQFPGKEYINWDFPCRVLGRHSMFTTFSLVYKAAETAILRVMLRLCTTPSSASTTPFLPSSGQRVHQITIEGRNIQIRSTVKKVPHIYNICSNVYL